MSRKLEIWYDKADEKRFHSMTAILDKGICTFSDQVVTNAKPFKIEYTSEYAMIQRIVKEFSNGHMVVDKGVL